jgi:hypothetical protein
VKIRCKGQELLAADPAWVGADRGVEQLMIGHAACSSEAAATGSRIRRASRPGSAEALYARPLTTHQVIVHLISNTAATTWLTVHCILDTGRDPTGLRYARALSRQAAHAGRGVPSAPAVSARGRRVRRAGRFAGRRLSCW